MLDYVILNSNGRFVAVIPQMATNKLSSFTLDILKAKRYKTRELALNDCCGNEKPVSMASIIRNYITLTF